MRGRWRRCGHWLLVLLLGLLAGIGMLLLQAPQAVGQDRAAPCAEASVCLAQGVEALSRKDDEAGLALLQQVIAQAPNTPWAGRAELALGRYYQQQADQQAIPYLLAASQHLPILGDYALSYLGDAVLKTSDFTGAAMAFDNLVERYPDSLLMPQALAQAAESWSQADDCERSRERQGRFLAEYRGHALAPGVLLRQGDCRRKAGDRAAAVLTYRRIWVQYAASPQADDAAVRLDHLKGEGVAIPALTSEDRWLRATTFFAAGQYARAVKAFDEYLKSSPVPHRDRARLNLGIAHVRLKQYDEARSSFERARKGTDEGVAEEALVWLGRVFLRQGQGMDEPFLALARAVEAGRVSGEARAKFLLLLAAHHTDRGRINQAIQIYRQAGEQAEALAAEGLYRTGWLLYQQGRFEDAGLSFDQSLRAQPNGPYVIPALYWKARSVEKSGEAHLAAILFRALCGEAPRSYYCLSARLRPAAMLADGLVAVTDSASSGAWNSLAWKETPVADSAHYQRAVELRMVGLLREAAGEAAMLIEQISADRGEMFWMAGLLKEFGEPHRALKVVQLAFPEVLERGGDDVPSAFWELAYPQGWLPAIQAAATNGVDPYLIAAVIREESVYNPDAISPVGALGLMQVMPQTGQMIARKLGEQSFIRERLFNPLYNIRLGSWYLGHLAEQFDHNPVYMVAAYNAGPEAVAKWVRQFRGGETDEFIESIPYTETRLYVKRVLRSHREYRRVSGRACVVSFEKGC